MGQKLRGQHQRSRHWAAIALLRCVLSSPEVAVAVLSEHARHKGFGEEILCETQEEMDRVYRRQVLEGLSPHCLLSLYPYGQVLGNLAA
ncbi:MAG: hypothetical protein JRI50_09840 [Deltaproteobacteria bacterium]|nr:hypothetical protein [Deltaproteobacteria bacterium]